VTTAKPTPVVDVDSAFFWDGLREHRLVLQQCRTCGRFRFPPMMPCPYCGSRELDQRTLTGRGTVYSWVGVHRALDPAFADDVPYTVAAVDLDEGARVIVRLAAGKDADATAFGACVRATYVDHADWTELRFVVEEPAP
jgi:uncharacterized OB-fold protein